MTLAIERRVATRYETVKKQTTVRFMEWADRRITLSRLVNISATGALILTDKVPILYQPLWLRLENAPGTRWITAEPVRFGRFRDVGIRFHHPCPRHFFLAATLLESMPSVSASEGATHFLDEGTSESSAPPEYPW